MTAILDHDVQTPRVLEDLTEEECALWAILSDASGIDQAEFLWLDEKSEDLCWRAWDFQWQWYHCQDPLQVDQCARAVGKTQGILVRACAFPLVHPGEEMLITAPEAVHLEPVTQLIESQILATRLYRELLPPRGRSTITHKPFRVSFINGSRIIGRIPQRDGKGVKGMHPLWLELDEAQDYPHAGWVELTETLKRGSTNAIWRAHGVTRGIRDDFYERTQDTPDNVWKIHRYAAMWRPTWTDDERKEKIKQYGSRDDPDYRRNILGLHGDATNPLFVLHRLMACVDSDETSDYNLNEYCHISIKAESLSFYKQTIEDTLDLPERHRKKYLLPGKARGVFWAGMDVGYTTDPSEILIYVEHRRNPKDDEAKLKLLTRIHMERIGHQDQVKAILRVIDFYKPRVFAMDKTGLGLPLFQDIQQTCQKNPALAPVLDVIKGYNFSEKIVVDLDSTIQVSEFADNEELAREAGIRRTVVEYASDTLRSLVDSQRLELPWDAELLKQFQGSTWTSVRSMDQYGRKIYSKHNDHTLDASRMAVLGYVQYSIETMLNDREAPPVFDAFLDF